MSKYYFIQEDDDGNRITHEFYSDYHDEVAERFNEFLLGCGFVFNEGARYELTEPETTATTGGDAGVWPFAEDCDFAFPEDSSVMTWTSDELTKSEPLYTIREPGEFQSWNFPAPGDVLCPKCKLSKAIMRNSKCFDTNCGMV